MKRHTLAIMIASVLTLALSVSSIGQTAARYFDSANEPEGIQRLTIFYPSVGTIRAILALKEQGFLPKENFEIVGVHHARERTNYRDAERLVENSKIDWIKFHTVTAPLGPADLYKTNAASKEFEEIFRKSDGIIFFGGPDIPPSVFGQKTSLLTRIEDPYRHYLELSAIFHLLGGSQDDGFSGLLEKRPDFPVLGICLGCQSLNVGTGGTLVQDIWMDTYGKTFVEDIISLGQPFWHTNPWAKLEPTDRSLLPYMLHPIKLEENGKLSTELGFKPADQPYIMSAHHQAVDRLGKGFKIAATSLDGKVVEAIEHTRFPNVLGVQFHPEFPMLWDAKPRYKLTPQDKDLIAINAYLRAHPPSLEFHKKLWAGFFGKLKK